MFWAVILMMILIPIVEIWGFIVIGNWVGVFPTISFVLLGALIGIFLAKRGGLEAYRLAEVQMRNGQLPGEAMLDGFCILIGALLLITPGFFTDILGLLFFIPLTRAVIKGGLKRWLEKKLSTGNVQMIWFGSRKQ